MGGWAVGLARRVKNERLGLTQKKDRVVSCTGRLRVCVGLFMTVTKKIIQGEKRLFWVTDPEISLHHGEEGVAE